jgi:hypothetical protein
MRVMSNLGWRLEVLRAGVVLVALGALLALAPGSAVGAQKRDNHCITPLGDDLNEVFGIADAFVAPFCPAVGTDDRWTPVSFIQFAGSDFVFPPGYTPIRHRLVRDFLAKFVAAKYVVDAGTARERTYNFLARKHLIRRRQLPDGTHLLRFAPPSLHHLPEGKHSVDRYVWLSAEFWDGLGTDPAVNQVPEGRNLWNSDVFKVVKPH